MSTPPPSEPADKRDRVPRAKTSRARQVTDASADPIVTTRARPPRRVEERVANRIAGTNAREVHDAFLRDTARFVLNRFWWLNLALTATIIALLAVDVALFLSDIVEADQRLVGERTIIALIAGSAFQFGALALAVGRGLFQARRD